MIPSFIIPTSYDINITYTHDRRIDHSIFLVFICLIIFFMSSGNILPA